MPSPFLETLFLHLLAPLQQYHYFLQPRHLSKNILEHPQMHCTIYQMHHQILVYTPNKEGEYPSQVCNTVLAKPLALFEHQCAVRLKQRQHVCTYCNCCFGAKQNLRTINVRIVFEGSAPKLILRDTSFVCTSRKDRTSARSARTGFDLSIIPPTIYVMYT